MTTFKNDFGKRLKYIRTLKGITQEQLSELVNIEQRQLSRIETGKSYASFGTFEKICTALQIEAHDFFNFSSDDLNTQSINQNTKEIINEILKIKDSPNKIKFIKLVLSALNNDKKSLLKLQSLVESMLILLEE